MPEIAKTDRASRSSTARPYSSPTRAAVRLLGSEIERQRKQRRVTAADLAERFGVVSTLANDGECGALGEASGVAGPARLGHGDRVVGRQSLLDDDAGPRRDGRRRRVHDEQELAACGDHRTVVARSGGGHPVGRPGEPVTALGRSGCRGPNSTLYG